MPVRKTKPFSKTKVTYHSFNLHGAIIFFQLGPIARKKMHTTFYYCYYYNYKHTREIEITAILSQLHSDQQKHL